MRLTTLAALFCVALCFSTSIAHASSVATESSAAAAADENIDYANIDLHALTNDELVAICTDRGFELVTDVDDATGEPLSYSHDDYVDAARECLQLEAEMEEYLASNPNMLKEVEEERERMLKEQEKLERQLKETRGQLNAENAASSVESTAFVQGQSTSDIIEFVTESKETEERYVAPGEIAEKESKNTASREDLPVDDDEVIDLDDTMNEVIEESQIDESQSEAEAEGAAEKLAEPTDAVRYENQTPTIPSADSEVASHADTGHHGLLVSEFKEVAIEFCQKVKQDFNRVADIVLPKPMRGPLKRALKKGYEIGKEITFHAVDMIKRYSKALIEKGKTAYENRKHEQEQKRDKSECNAEQEKAADTSTE